jgi:hypothetical protein
MKRIRKFNESKEEIDYEYIYQCFAELLDDNRAEIELMAGKEPYIAIRLRTKSKEDSRITNQVKSIKDKKSPIYNYIIGHNSNNELLKELEVSLDRLSEEYPDYKLQFNVFDSSIFIDIFSNKKEEQYPF